MAFSKPVFRPGGVSQHATYIFTKTEIILSLWRLKRQQIDFLKFISNSHIMGLFLFHLEPIDKYVRTPP